MMTRLIWRIHGRSNGNVHYELAGVRNIYLTPA